MSHQIEVAWDLVEWEPRDFDQETVVIIFNTIKDDLRSGDRRSSLIGL